MSNKDFFSLYELGFLLNEITDTCKKIVPYISKMTPEDDKVFIHINKFLFKVMKTYKGKNTDVFKVNAIKHKEPAELILEYLKERLNFFVGDSQNSDII